MRRTLGYIRNQLERETRVAVHNHGDVEAVAADVDVLRLSGIGAAVGAGSAGLPAGVGRHNGSIKT